MGMQPDHLAEAWHETEGPGPNIQAPCDPGRTNAMLLGITQQYVSEYPGCFTSHAFPSEMNQDFPTTPPQSGHRQTSVA